MKTIITVATLLASIVTGFHVSVTLAETQTDALIAKNPPCSPAYAECQF